MKCGNYIQWVFEDYMTLPIISYLNNLNDNLFTLKTILSVSNGFSVVYTLSCDENCLKSTVGVTLKIHS